jgi:hypothetical protein
MLLKFVVCHALGDPPVSIQSEFEAADITRLCQLASHSIYATKRSVRVREEMHANQDGNYFQNLCQECR